MRRLIALILSLVVLLLSCMPCHDVPAGQPGGAAQATAYQPTAGNHCSDADGCSPFCTCSCCAGIVLPAPLALLAVKADAFLPQPDGLLRHAALPGVFLPIWQPPQLV